GVQVAEPRVSSEVPGVARVGRSGLVSLLGHFAPPRFFGHLAAWAFLRLARAERRFFAVQARPPLAPIWRSCSRSSPASHSGEGPIVLCVSVIGVFLLATIVSRSGFAVDPARGGRPSRSRLEKHPATAAIYAHFRLPPSPAQRSSPSPGGEEGTKG